MNVAALLDELIAAGVISGYTSERSVSIWTRGCGCCSYEADLTPDAQKALRAAIERSEAS